MLATALRTQELFQLGSVQFKPARSTVETLVSRCNLPSAGGDLKTSFGPETWADTSAVVVTAHTIAAQCPNAEGEGKVGAGIPSGRYELKCTQEFDWYHYTGTTIPDACGTRQQDPCFPIMPNALLKGALRLHTDRCCCPWAQQDTSLGIQDPQPWFQTPGCAVWNFQQE